MTEHQPTPEQLERLSRVTDEKQRSTILRAIERGEEMPDFAWEPLPEMSVEQQAVLDAALRPIAERLAQMATEGVDVNQLLQEVGDEFEREQEPIDLSYRPETYWPDEDSLELRVARIRGEQRRLRAEALLRSGRAEELEELEPLLDEELSEEDRKAWGSLHPLNLGGEFLPPMERDEVEIARVALASTTGDVYSIRARANGPSIEFSIADEYELPWDYEPKTAEKPLTMAELIALMDTAEIVDGDGHPGVALGVARDWLESDVDPQHIRDGIRVSSAFYPKLGEYYTRSIDALLYDLAD